MVENSSPGGQGGAAVLCSAGLDSAVLLADEAMRGPVTPVYVSTGLAWEDAERRALARLLASPPFAGRVASPPAFLALDMRLVYSASHWAVQGRPPAFDTPDEDVYLPGRNLVLLAQAGVLAAQRRLTRIVLGPLAGNPFPDATPEFFESMALSLSLGLDWPLAVAAPYREWTKADVIRRGRALGVPLDLTLSCMDPQDLAHCGRCSKCRERHDAFVEAGERDPTQYASELPR
jgi:7-cyano-7-deazaguanine synthase